jgi:4-carboxymuconolactone decarboxylase
VSAAEHALGGRLALFDPDAVTTTQRELFDRITATAAPWAQHSGFAATTAGGRLIGPFNPSLLSPAIATEFLKLQAAEEQYTSLDERQRQVVILTVGEQASGAAGVFEITALTGVYHTVCGILNAFDIPAPDHDA